MLPKPTRAMINPANCSLPSERAHAPSILRVFCLALLLSCSGGKADSPTTPTIPVVPTPIPVAIVTVTPTTQSLMVGGTQQLAATTLDASGAVLQGRAVTWISSSSAVVTVSSSGLAAAVAAGSATITATSEGKSGSTAFSVRQVPVARVVITPSTLAMGPWETSKLSATAYDSAGNALAGRQVSWVSSAPTLVRIDATGTLTSNLIGSSAVTATAEGVIGTAQITVTTSAAVTVGANVSLDPSVATGETSVTINPKNPLNIAASANWRRYSSFDGGRSWQGTATVGPAAEVDPSLAFDARGVLFWQGLTLYQSPPRPRQLYVDRSTDGGRSVSGSVAAYDPGTVAHGEADQGMMTIDTVSTSPYLNSIYVVAPDYYAASPLYSRIGAALILVASHDGGVTWSAPKDISDCNDSGQEPSVGITTGPNGEVYAAWPVRCQGIDQFKFTRSLDGGQTWAPNISVGRMASPPAFPVSDDVRGNVTIDVDRSNGPNRGTIYLSALDGSGADAWFVRSTDGGNTWSSRIFLSDGPRGPYKFYFQPHINVAPNGRVDAVWYDTRNWGGSDNRHVSYDVYYAYSTNGGLSFSPSVRVTSALSTMNHNCPDQNPCGDRSIGEYMGLASDNTRALPVWTDRRGSTPQPYFATIWIKP
jgi:hypothetical protein